VIGELTVAGLDLAVMALLTAWLIEGLARAARHYIRSGRILAQDARRMMTRGALGVAVYVAVDVLPVGRWLVHEIACRTCS